MVSLAAKRLSALGMENTVHTLEAAGVSASITFAYTCSLGLYGQIHTHARMRTHACTHAYTHTHTHTHTNSKASWLFMSLRYQ